MSAVALEVRGLEVRLRRAPDAQALVRDLDLELPRGEITGLAGRSGSGKTLTALALMGLADPNAFQVRCQHLALGEHRLDPAAPGSWRGVRGRHMAMVFQDPATALDPVFTVGSQLSHAIARSRGLSRRESDQEARAALGKVGFPDPEAVARRYPHELSGGMRQLCVIAMAQAVRPSVLLADEPTTALDACTQARVLLHLERLADTAGTAVLLVTHDLRLLTRHARRVLVMLDGEIVERTTGDGLRQHPEHHHTAELVAALPRGEARVAPAPAGRPLVAIRDLVAGYRPRRSGWRRPGMPVDAVRSVSLDLHPGRIHGLAGESGSGKSTLARTLVQLVQARSGSVTLDGRELVNARGAVLQEARRRIQLVFQDPATALSPRRTIAQTLREPARHFGLDASDSRLTEVLEAVGLDASALPRLPRQFSSGQRQRIAIARALVCDPDLLIADEALASLDVSVQAQVLTVLRRLREERNMAMLLISHDLSILRENADETSILYGGHLVEHGPTHRVFATPAHPYTRQLLDALPHFGPGPAPAEPARYAGLAPVARGAGCVFEPRCEQAMPACRIQSPSTTTLPENQGHRVECLLHAEPKPRES